LLGFQLCLQLLYLGILCAFGLLQRLLGLCLVQFTDLAILASSLLKPFMKLPVKILVTNLLQDVGISGLVNSECSSAFGANNFGHMQPFLSEPVVKTILALSSLY